MILFIILFVLLISGLVLGLYLTKHKPTPTPTPIPQPIDGVWSEWEKDGDCSKTCGSGQQLYKRTCTPPKNNGKECEGDATKSESCNVHECPIDGVWSEWVKDGDCSKTCGSGQQLYKRTCTPPKNNGKACEGDATKSESCNVHECPIDGVWSEWEKDGDCSKTCGSGQQMYKRTCTPSKNNGKACEGDATKSESCNVHACQTTSFVLLDLKRQDNVTLNIAELQVFDENGVNVALNKPVTFSSKWVDASLHPKNIVNGNITDLGHSHDKQSNHEWFQVNLMGEYIVGSVKVINRTTAHHHSRIIGATINLRGPDHKIHWKSPPITIGKSEYTWIIPNKMLASSSNLVPSNELDCKMYGSFWNNNKCNLNMIEFNGIDLDLRYPIPNYNPEYKPGIVVFDNNGVMCMLTRTLKYHTNFYFSYKDNNNWITFNLMDMIKTRITETPDSYKLFTNSDTISFDKDNNAFIVYNSHHIIKFNYKTQQIIETHHLPSKEVRLEMYSFTNNHLYNNYPIVLHQYGLARYEKSANKYITYTYNPLNTTQVVTTVTHSGKHSNAYTHKGKTYFVYATISVNVPSMPNYILVFDHVSKTFNDPVYLGKYNKNHDDHNGPSLTITSKGHIYVFFGNHNELIFYTHTTTPLDVNSFTNLIPFPSVTGQDSSTVLFTYPGVRIDKFDNIHITYRGPKYGFTYFKLTPHNNNIVHKNVITNKKIHSINGVNLSNSDYKAWRDVMTIGDDGTVYILISPRVIGTWETDLSVIKSFIIYSLKDKHNTWFLL